MSGEYRVCPFAAIDEPQLQFASFRMFIESGLHSSSPLTPSYSIKFWIPSTQKYIRDGRELSVRIREELHQYVKRDMVSVTQRVCMTSF